MTTFQSSAPGERAERRTPLLVSVRAGRHAPGVLRSYFMRFFRVVGAAAIGRECFDPDAAYRSVQEAIAAYVNTAITQEEDHRG